ncbi:hypothetical protein IGI04_042632 [Brassica rapa subsp. trilocularis]|uniref:Uncharacterized protein n=1 Tax=Brassica rapa subsp. trilocularis TaxID=1813537 RepID=A0ABQ7KLG0_BRACM|nr:hypothetical protein IGI04_042750 [Brassica rapa subsp. trilocularis]KAG5374069.1 hypothetical protein IGI04_042632 [Brassica rapa subsp. trilocularis]
MDQLSNGDDEDLDKPTDGDVLALPKGPMTRSRSRKLTQVIGGLVKRSWKQEECLEEGNDMIMGSSKDVRSLFDSYLRNHEASTHEITLRMCSTQLRSSSKKNQIK